MPTTAAELLAKALYTMEERISTHSQAMKFSDQWGWQRLPLDKTDLAYLARVVAERLDAADWCTSADAETLFSDLANKAGKLKGSG